MATASIFIRLAQAPPLIIAVYRLIISSLILGLIYGKKIEFKWDAIPLMIISGISLGIHFYTWISSVLLTSVANAVVLVNTNPIFIVLLSLIIDKKKPPAHYFLSLFFVIIGMILITNNDINLALGKGELLAIIGGFCMAVYLYIGNKVSNKVSFITYITLVYSTASIFLFIINLFSSYPLFNYPLKTYFFILLLALIPQLIGHSSANYAIRILPPSSVALMILGENVFATIFAYIFLKESISLLQAFGMIIISFAIFYNSLKEREAIL